MMTVTLTQHERNEWIRMAKAAYAKGHNDIGHVYSAAAAKASIPVAQFDSLQRDYRAWLIDGFAAFEG